MGCKDLGAWVERFWFGGFRGGGVGGRSSCKDEQNSGSTAKRDKTLVSDLRYCRDPPCSRL